MDASREKLYTWLTFLVYVILVSFIAFHHVPWRDEAQAWLIARDCNLLGMYHQLGYEGTPGLWHLILFPFAQLGFPYISMQIIHALLAIGVVYVFLFHAPFPLLFRIPFVFSYYIAYEYAVIARSYVLTVLLLFVIATQYSKRFTNPLRYSLLVFLLFQTNLHACFIAASLLLAYLVETAYQKKYIFEYKTSYYGALVIMLLGAVLAFMQLMLPIDTMHPGVANEMKPFIIIKAVQHAFFP